MFAGRWGECGNVGRKQKHLSLANRDLPNRSVFDDSKDDVALDLEEEFFPILDVKILPLVRPSDRHHHELGILPYHLVADGRLEKAPMLFDPGLQIDGGQQHGATPG